MTMIMIQLISFKALKISQAQVYPKHSLMLYQHDLLLSFEMLQNHFRFYLNSKTLGRRRSAQRCSYFALLRRRQADGELDKTNQNLQKVTARATSVVKTIIVISILLYIITLYIIIEVLRYGVPIHIYLQAPVRHKKKIRTDY